MRATARAQTRDFDVRLDGQPIGRHRFAVTLLGSTLHRDRHEVRERWRGDCPQDMHARATDRRPP